MRDRTFRSLTLVLDENLSGHRILAGLRAEGIPVKPQTDFLHRGASDEQVLKSLASHPTCFLISKDSDFHRKDAVKIALIQHGIGAFVITAHKNKTAADLVQLIAAAWPRIQREAERQKRPFVSKITSDGSVHRVC